MSAERNTGIPSETQIISSKKSPEKRRELGARFVMDLAIALSSVIYKNKKLPSDTSCTSCAFISEALTTLADSHEGLTNTEKEDIKTTEGVIKKWLDGKTTPAPEKFAAIRQLLIKIRAPEELIPNENFFQ